MSKLTFEILIIWLDQGATLPDDYIQLKKVLLSITNPEDETLINIDDPDIRNLIRDGSTLKETTFLRDPILFKFFSEIEPCFQFLLENAGKIKIFFITSGSLGKTIVPKILPNHKEIFQDKNGKLYEDSIYIFCTDMAMHSIWAEEYLDDFGCLKMENNDKFVLARLPRDIAKYFISQGEELFQTNHIESLNNAKQYYLWSKQLYLKADSVQKMPSTSDDIKIIDQHIEEIEKKIQQLTNQQDDQIGLSQEN